MSREGIPQSGQNTEKEENGAPETAPEALSNSATETQESARSESAAEVVATYRELDQTIEKLSDGGERGIHDLVAWVGTKQRLGSEIREIPAQFKESSQLLRSLSEDVQKQFEATGIDPEEMKQAFMAEHLASLPMDEYVTLLKRFPNAMVTHVTRQGIRDHTGMWEHTKGKGEYADGFIKILESGELKSPLAVAAIAHGKENAVARALRLDDPDTNRQDAQERLRDKLAGHFDGYADTAAVHVATEAVADSYYGSEKGNEIFIAFPSAHIAAEHQFIGNLSQSKETMHNDTWILKDNGLEQGMNINAGVAFIPAEARVDPETGSRYMLEHNSRNPVENTEVRNRISDLIASPELLQYAKEVMDGNYSQARNKEELQVRFNSEDPRLQDALANSINNIYYLRTYQDNPAEFERRKEGVIASVLEHSGMRFKEAESTVSSQEFWEAYFAKHPEQKPSKIEYYKGDDPTAALLKWKERNGLTSAGTEELYDLGGRVESTEKYQSEDKDRFKSIAEKIIDERFSVPPAEIPERGQDESLEDWQAQVRAIRPPPPPPPQEN